MTTRSDAQADLLRAIDAIRAARAVITAHEDEAEAAAVALTHYPAELIISGEPGGTPTVDGPKDGVSQADYDAAWRAYEAARAWAIEVRTSLGEAEHNIHVALRRVPVVVPAEG